MSNISNIKVKVRYLIWAKAAGRCQFNGCNKTLYQDDHTQIEMNFADVAHIIGQGEKGPRSYKTSDIEERYVNDISNLMLVCPKHHKLIDQKPSTYPEDLLRKMKRAHENKVRLATEMKVDNTSNVLIYRGRIGEFQPSISFRETMQAMFPDYYPADHRPIELSMSGSLLEDNDPKYWEFHARNLEMQFEKNVAPLLGDKQERNHYSIFAFAPIPLLIKLGSLLPDHYPAQVYQPKKEPKTWKWQPEPPNFDFLLTEPVDRKEHNALNLSLSADISDERIYDAMETEDVSIWKLDIRDTEFPKTDHLRSKGQITLFSSHFRKLLNKIKEIHGQHERIHVFPAIPVAYAVQIGRVRQPKADLPLIIYDQNNKNGGFAPTITIE